MFNTIPILFGFGMTFIDVLMEVSTKYYSVTVPKPVLLLIFAMATYALQPYIFSKALKYEGMALMNINWNVVSTTILVIFGVFIFKEKIGKFQWVGVVLSIISLILLGFRDY